jgi:hypothetical protein
MIRIAITQAALRRHRRHHAAGSVGYEAQRNAKGEVHG